MGNFSELAEDIVVKIASLLPIKSLDKLKRVNKSLHVLIDSLMRDPKFANKHAFRFNNNNDESISYLVFDQIRNDLYLKIFDDDDIESNKSFTNDMSFVSRKLTPTTWYKRFSLLGRHCNGLVCLVNPFTDRILICNPFTKQLKTLPRDSPGKKIQRVGFGYDPVSDEYKVIKICKIAAESSTAHVYALGGSTWRQVEYSPTAADESTSFNFVHKAQAYLDGVYYWIHPEVEGALAIQAFDVCLEKFRTVVVPQEFQTAARGGCHVRLIPTMAEGGGGCSEVALLLWDPKRPMETEMWGMSSGGGKVWTRRETIVVSGLEDGVVGFPMAFLSGGRILMRGGFDEREVASYDQLTKEVRYYYTANTRGFRAFGFHPTLLSF